VQASAIVTVMVVSFVQTGLLSLTESIGIIMGANIGTTIKIWLISYIGFNKGFEIYALPLIGLCLPLLFSKNQIRKNWGEFIVGFALLFLSLGFLKMIFDDFQQHQFLIDFLSGYSAESYGSIVLFVGIGMLITALVQSSSATVMLTIVLCVNKWIPFELGAAMILGENIGTTITANIAALIANAQAKRAALSHTLFNVIGVLWALLLFKYFIMGVNFITIYILDKSPLTDATATPIGLAVFHTSFNVLNTLLLVGFIPALAKLSTYIYSSKKSLHEEKDLKFIGSQFASSELLLIEVKKEIVLYAYKAKKMFALIPPMLIEKDETAFEKLFQQSGTLEELMDKKEEQISTYINELFQGDMSLQSMAKAKSMQRIVKEMENIGDISYHMAKTIRRKNIEKTWFTQDMRDNLNKMFTYLHQAFDVLIANLDYDYERVSLDKAQMLELMINKLRSDLLQEHHEKSALEEYNNKSEVIYFDLITSSERMADHIYNINEAITGLK
jgi:phosphate:Na+ symporter